jgi:hypothetical protein
MAKDVKKLDENLPAELDPEFNKMLQEDAGKGVSTAAEDNLVPLIYILQPLSPQVMDGPAFIEGAKPGDIWLKNASEPIVKGKDGIWFMPCYMYQRWTEWVPRDKGGGFVASYDYDGRDNPPPGAERDTSVKNRPRFYFPETGNECIETRYEAGFVWRDGIPLPYVIPFKSTGHSVSRGWMTKRMNQRRKDGSIWQAWSHIYKLTTTVKRNAQGSWYIFEIGDPKFYVPKQEKQVDAEALQIIGGNAKEAYMLGRNLEKAFAAGQKIEMHEDVDTDASAGEGGDDFESEARERGKKEAMQDEIPF